MPSSVAAERGSDAAKIREASATQRTRSGLSPNPVVSSASVALSAQAQSFIVQRGVGVERRDVETQVLDRA